MNISLRYFRLVLVLAFLGSAIVAVAQPSSYEYHELEVNQTFIIDNLPPGIPMIPALGHPDHGSLWIEVVNNEERVVYQPDSNFVGVDTFYFQVFNPPLSNIFLGYEVEVSESMIFTERDYASTLIATPVTVFPLDNDSTSTGGLSLHSVSPIYRHGSVSISNGDQFEFTPNSGFEGITHMSYIACNNDGKCEKGVISILVHDYGLPSTQSGEVLTSKEEPIPVLLPHTDYLVSQNPSNGTLIFLEDFSYLYTPNAGFSGQDNFVFELVTPNGTSVYSVTAEVMDIPPSNNFANDDYAYAPISSNGSTIYGIEIDVLDNDAGNLLGWTLQITSSPTHGMAWLIGNGKILYTPPAGYEGVDKFTYQVANALGVYETATVYATVSNFTPGATSFDLTTYHDTPIFFEYDAPILGYNFNVVSGPVAGTVDVTWNTVKYTPPGYTGVQTFTLEYCINSNGNCFQFDINVDVIQNPGGTQGCVGENEDCLWAGDMNQDGVVDGKDVLSLCAIGEVGLPRSGNNTNWIAQFSSNWPNTVVGINKNIKHIDSDGDSLITKSDVNVVDLNYGKRSKVTPQILPTQQNPLIFNVLNYSTEPGDTVVIEVIMGENNNPARDFSGLSFQMLYNPVIFDSAWVEFYEDSWLAYDAPLMSFSKIPFDGKLDVALTRADETSKSGFGPVGTVKIVVDDLNGIRFDEDEEFTTISFVGTSGLTRTGHLTKLNDAEINIQVNESDFDPELNKNVLNVYPNPTDEFVTISTNYHNPMEEIRIFNLMGQLIYSKSNVGTNEIELDVSYLESGIYIIDVNAKEGPAVRKLEVLRP